MAARRGKNQARRNSGNGTPGWVWLVAGAAIAAVVFLAAPNLFKKEGDGFLRVGPQPNPDAQPAPVADADIDAGADLPRPAARGSAQPADKPAATQYDFYTLLPGKEVQMSDAELAASARAEEQRRAQAARAAQSGEAQRAQAALEGRPVPPAAAPLPAPISEAPRPAATGGNTAARTGPATPTAPVAAPVADATAKRPEPAAPAVAAASDNVRYILQAGAFGASGDAGMDRPECRRRQPLVQGAQRTDHQIGEEAMQVEYADHHAREPLRRRAGDDRQPRRPDQRHAEIEQQQHRQRPRRRTQPRSRHQREQAIAEHDRRAAHGEPIPVPQRCEPSPSHRQDDHQDGEDAVRRGEPGRRHGQSPDRRADRVRHP